MPYLDVVPSSASLTLEPNETPPCPAELSIGPNLQGAILTFGQRPSLRTGRYTNYWNESLLVFHITSDFSACNVL